jgi:Rrf2 family protein
MARTIRRRRTVWSTHAPTKPGTTVDQSSCSSTSVPAPVAEKRLECTSHRNPCPGPSTYTSRNGRTDTTSDSGAPHGRPSARATSKATDNGASTTVVKRSWNTAPLSQTRRWRTADRAEWKPAAPGRMEIVRITARVDYAVRAALELAAAAPGALTNDAIAAAQGIPSRFLQAILGDLQHARLVTSQRGREGGYRLALPPEEVSIARVMRVEQGFLAEVHGQRPEDVEYPGSAAPLTAIWIAARAAYRRVLEEVTLADVISGKLPAAITELAEVEDAWRSFGDASSG